MYSEKMRRPELSEWKRQWQRDGSRFLTSSEVICREADSLNV